MLETNNNLNEKGRADLIKSFIYFLLLFLIIFISLFLYKKSFKEIINKNEQQIVTNNQEVDPPNSSDKYKIRDDNATYTVINYYSLDCIYCQRLWLVENQENNESKLKGKINLIYRSTSLFSQPLSGEKALISECLYSISNTENYFKFINNIYNMGDYINTQKNNDWIKKEAEKYVDKEKLAQCINNPNNKKLIQDQKNKDIIQNIKFTPTLVVFDKNNKLVNKYENVGGVLGWRILESLAK